MTETALKIFAQSWPSCQQPLVEKTGYTCEWSTCLQQRAKRLSFSNLLFITTTPSQISTFCSPPPISCAKQIFQPGTSSPKQGFRAFQPQVIPINFCVQ